MIIFLLHKCLFSMATFQLKASAAMLMLATILQYHAFVSLQSCIYILHSARSRPLSANAVSAVCSFPTSPTTCVIIYPMIPRFSLGSSTPLGTVFESRIEICTAIFFDDRDIEMLVHPAKRGYDEHRQQRQSRRRESPKRVCILTSCW